ncbi:MAG: protoheme IX farnesyltransferase [Gemmatimonadetes bacterium]|nr:protoheme IX farnesyltransferase [Gemmatimonadota bacterium]MYK65702.1 protoheme IX farnesyltransferase [Gemmatimonadota bacterium]
MPWSSWPPKPHPTSPVTPCRSTAASCRGCFEGRGTRAVPRFAGPVSFEERIRAGWGGRAGAYLELTKPGITIFVAVTAVAAYVLAAIPAVDLPALLHLVAGITLSTAGSLALNQYLERRPDSVMLRTRGRPVPSGRIRARHARLFGCLLILAGIGHLWFWLGWLPALITAIAALLYDGVYTPLKLRSALATPVGAVPGALPALIGWTAHTEAIDARGMTLFGILFLWQLIHVLALGWNLRRDYERAGFQLIPPGSDRLIAGLMVGHAAALLPLSVVPRVLGMSGSVYLAGALVLGGGMLAVSVAFMLDPTKQRCSRVFLGSLLYHPLLLGVMVAGAL